MGSNDIGHEPNAEPSSNHTEDSRPGAYLLWIPVGGEADNVYLSALLTRLLRFKVHLAVALMTGLMLGFGGSYLLTPWYQAESLVLPVQDDAPTSGLSSTLGQLGGLATLAGVNLPGASTEREETLAILSSHAFAAKFINQSGIHAELARGREEFLDVAQAEDGDTVTLPVKLVEEFLEEILQVREVEGTMLVRIAMRWPEREHAAVWSINIVKLLNETLRTRSIDDANKQIELLSKHLSETSNLEIRNSIYRLLEGQLHKIVLAGAREEFALRTIDPAVVPDEDDYIWPNRIVLAGVGGVTMLGLALLLVVIREPLLISAGVKR